MPTHPSQQAHPLARALATAQAARGGSLRELARAAGVTHPTVARWQRLDHEPPLGAAARLAEALGLRLELVAPGSKNTAPCGHKVKLPDPSGYVVKCSACGGMAEWVLVGAGA